MDFARRLLGALRPTPQSTTENARPPEPPPSNVPASYSDFLQSLICPGDDTEILDRLVAGGVDLNQPPDPQALPIVIRDGIVARQFDTYPAIVAAMLHKAERLRVLLEAGARWDIKCGNGSTPLHWAVAGDEDVVAYATGKAPNKLSADQQRASLACTRHLLERGADPNAFDRDRFTPLHMACIAEGKLEHVQLMLALGAKVDVRSNDGTPLSLAARFGQLDVVIALLQAGADVGLTDRIRSRTALHWACASGHASIVQLLLRNGADPVQSDGEGLLPSTLAMTAGSVRALRHLHEAGATVHLVEGWQAQVLSGALARSDDEALRALAEGVDLNVRLAGGNVLWHEVIERGRPASDASRLLEHGASVHAENASGERALHLAAAHGRTSIVSMLLSKGAEVDAGSYRPLHLAATAGHVDVARVLLDAGARPQGIADQWHSPLGLAIANDHQEMAKVLLAAVNKAVGVRDLIGLDPLYIASERGNVEMVQLLLAERVDVDGSAQDGSTPLHAALEHSGDELVRILLQAGANPNAPSEMGITPLHRAAAMGRADLMRLLTRRGADPAARDLSGKGLEHFAQSSGVPAAIAEAGQLVRKLRPPSDTDLRSQVLNVFKYHVQRAPRRLHALQRQGYAVLTARGEKLNDIENPWILNGPGLGTAMVAVYQKIEESLGRQDRGVLAGERRPGWVLERASSEVQGSSHLHCMSVRVAQLGTIEFRIDVTACVPQNLADVSLLAHQAVMSRP